MASKPAGKRLVKSKSGLKMVCQHDREASPWDMAEPPWVPDAEVQACSTCSAKFDFIHRKHHCRRCGRIFCGKCCSSKVEFHRMGFVDPVRHCAVCAIVTKAEAEFFSNHIKLLFNGAPFHISTSSSPLSSPTSEDISFGSPTSSNSKLYHCKLSSDQRTLLFEPFESSSESGSLRSGSDSCNVRINPVEISKVLSSEIFFTDDDDKKGAGSGLTLQVKVPGENDLLMLTMLSPPEPSRKPSVAFINALQKGLAMTIESRTPVSIELLDDSSSS